MQDSAAEQEALSAEIEQQEAAAQRLTQALAAERSFPGNAPSPVQGLERVPTAAVMGQQWADEVHAARAAQEDIDRRIAPEAGDAVARCGLILCMYETALFSFVSVCRPMRHSELDVSMQVIVGNRVAEGTHGGCGRESVGCRCVRRSCSTG